MPCIAEMDLRPIVYRRLLRGCKPRKNFNLSVTKAEEWYANMFKESYRRTKKMPQPDDLNFEEEMTNCE